MLLFAAVFSTPRSRSPTQGCDVSRPCIQVPSSLSKATKEALLAILQRAIQR
jgi:hypothetical protein